MKNVLDWILEYLLDLGNDERVLEACIKLVELLVELGVPMNELCHGRYVTARLHGNCRL